MRGCIHEKSNPLFPMCHQKRKKLNSFTDYTIVDGIILSVWDFFLPRVFTVSLENVLLDVKELQRGMELTKREYSMHGHNTMLKDFITHNESKLKKLQDDAKIAQVT